MPQHRKVPSLQALSLSSIGSMVVYLVPHIISEIKHESAVQTSLNCLTKLLSSHVPPPLYDEMAVEVLKAVKKLIEDLQKTDTPNLTEWCVALNLPKVVLTTQLKSIDFTKWGRPMEAVLYSNLKNPTNLENLNFGCTVNLRYDIVNRTNDLLDNIAKMKRLKSLILYFDCNDAIVKTVVESCPHIQYLDLTYSSSVTDRCVPHLLKCQNLRKLYLNETSISFRRFAELIAGLPNLQEIDNWKNFGLVMECLHHIKYSKGGPFGLRKVDMYAECTRNLRLCAQLFPKVDDIVLSVESREVDLMALLSLKHLKKLDVYSCAFYGNCIKQLLEVKGNNITSLYLDEVTELGIDALIDLSQFCPKLENVRFCSCDLTQDRPLRHNQELKIQPFLNLKRIHWAGEYSLQHLEFMLMHAINIRHIHLHNVFIDIPHSCIVRILTVNPMKLLQELTVHYSSDMSMRTVELLLENCMNIKVLSRLETWRGISTEELESFKEYIKFNNFDLDIKNDFE